MIANHVSALGWLPSARVTAFLAWSSAGPVDEPRNAPSGSDRLPVGTVSRTPPEEVVALATRRSPLDCVSWIPLPAVAVRLKPDPILTTRSCPGRPMLPEALSTTLAAVTTGELPPAASRIEPLAAWRFTS